MPLLLTRGWTGPAPDPDTLIRDRLTRGAGSFIYVAPTRRKIRTLLREFTAASPRGVSGPLNLFTLETLAGALCELLTPGRRLLRGPVQTAFVQEAIRTCDRLNYFRPTGSGRRIAAGTLEKLVNVINRFKESGVYLPVFRQEMGEGSKSDQARLEDIYNIYESYERLLADRYTDAAGQLRLVNLAWDPVSSAEMLRRRFPGADLLHVGGFDEFTDPELTLLENVSAAPGLSTIVSFDFHPGNEALFGHLSENYRKFLAIGFSGHEVPAQAASVFQHGMAASLFRPEGPVAGKIRMEAQGSGKAATGAAVSVHAAADRLREAELIAGIIKKTVRDDPSILLHNICVAVPRPELYSAIFRETFEAAGIPANITDRQYLGQAAPVAAFMSLLDVAQNDFRLEDILSALSGPYLKFDDAGGPVDRHNINRVAVALRIHRGKSTWRTRVEAALEPGHDPETERRRRGGIPRHDLERALADISRIGSVLEPFAKPMTPSEFAAAVEALAVRLRMIENIINTTAAQEDVKETAGSTPDPDDPDDMERDARAYTSFMGLLLEFVAALHVEMKASDTLGLRSYLERLRPILAGARYNIRRKPRQGVLVTTPDETRGLAFDVMIVAGLVDGEFPSGYEPEVFLTPRRRNRKEQFHLHTERYRFYQGVTNFNRSLHLTYPARDGGTLLQRSPFLDSFLAVADAEVPEPGAAHRVISSPDLLLESLGALHGPGAELPSAMAEHVTGAAAIAAARRIHSGSDQFRGLIGEAEGPDVHPVTELERYINCPFQYFALQLLGLRPVETLETGLPRKDFGSLIHEILYVFYTERLARNRPSIQNADDEEFARAVSEMAAVAEAIIDARPGEGAFWRHQRRTILGDDSGPGILRMMLDAERSSGLAAEPAYFEVPFGLPARRSSGPTEPAGPVQAGGIKISGKIDRIDVAGDEFRIVDYKTGGMPGRADLNEGRSLQLPLYLHAAETILRGPSGAGPRGVAGVYYNLKSGFKEWLGVGTPDILGRMARRSGYKGLPADDKAFAVFIQRAIDVANDCATGISSGSFPVAPSHLKHCRTCEARTVCRITEERSPDESADDPPDE